MHIERITAKNFRLLHDVGLALEDGTTVVVGRNNSGKTSLTEVFRRLMSEKPAFRLEDFSFSVHESFWQAYQEFLKGSDAKSIAALVPRIEVTIQIRYDSNAQSLGPLGAFIIDFEQNSTLAITLIQFRIREGQISALFEDIAKKTAGTEEDQRRDLFRAIRNRLQAQFETVVKAIDPTNPENTKDISWAELRSIMQCGFINAQRGLDDETQRDRAVLGKILEELLLTASAENATPDDKGVAEQLELAVENIQTSLDVGFNKQLELLLPAFGLFGFPALQDHPSLRTETILNVTRLLTNHTTVQYAGLNGINLPEGYNGLGTRNLIVILLKLLGHFKSYVAMQAPPAMHLIFIEEPEVHLHPQMQEVFISKLADIAKVFETEFKAAIKWPVQFVVTTHSSHVANRAPFEAIRYFLTKADSKSNRFTSIKDLRLGLSQTGKDDREFLHKYMTLTRTDFLFADKGVLIEGTTERILLPCMIKKLDNGRQVHQQLSSQYISVVEVGGAYAHLFFQLLNFLELRTLIITDFDSVFGKDNKKCSVSEGTHSSNATINAWFRDGDVSKEALLQKKTPEKIRGKCRLAYQIPDSEGSPCGRSFEQAFMLANKKLFELHTISDTELEQASYDGAQSAGKKSDFALKHALNHDGWTTPKYIAEGLEWLIENDATAPPMVLPPEKAVSKGKTATKKPAADK